MPQTEVADFTTNDAKPTECQKCGDKFEQETDRYYMRDSKPDGAGRYLCASCRQHYLTKSALAQRTAGIILYAFIHAHVQRAYLFNSQSRCLIEAGYSGEAKAKPK
jgi:hypothetical protein